MKCGNKLYLCLNQYGVANNSHCTTFKAAVVSYVVKYDRTNKDKEDKDLFIDPQEFVVGYSEAPEQPQSSARPICHPHAMTRAGREAATIRIAA